MDTVLSGRNRTALNNYLQPTAQFESFYYSDRRPKRIHAGAWKSFKQTRFDSGRPATSPNPSLVACVWGESIYAVDVE